ncbi:Hypothetical protein D9617_10g073410 [Elsinoe fawcettii]|nr:Hypothetical protein D9617_10g073410 [Elsinoe fawcettii]
MRVAVLVPIAAAIGQQKWLWFQLQKPGSRSYRSLEDMELLDSASRGPWGSIVLLFQRFGLHLGTLGAALVVISLAMGTFTQIIVSTQIQLVSETIPAPAWIQSFHSENGFSNRAMEFRRAFEQALLNTNETMLEMPTCPTGNCRWPVFPTLGMCGSCIDRTTEIELVCGLGSVPSKAVQTITAYCAYTLPGERVEREGSDIFGFDYNFDALPEIESFSKVKQNRTGEEIRGVRVFLVSASNTYQNNATGFNTFRIHDNTRRFSQGPTIQDCNFSWCIKAYNVSVVNGSLETEMVGDWSDFSTPPAPTIKFPQKPPSYFNLQSIPEPLVRSMEMGDTPWSVPAQIEQMPTRSVYATTRLFDQGPYLDSNLTFSEFRAMSMYKITDYQRWISNVAMSVTNAMRRTGDRPLNHAKYAGQAFTPKQFYHIRFWWLIFPGTLLILSILLLGTTIWITHEQRVEHWKNDALPLLYTTIDEDIRAQSQTPRDMADHQVVLVRTQGQSLMRKVL